MHPLLRKYEDEKEEMLPVEAAPDDAHLEQIAAECMEAIKEGSAAELKECLKAFFKVCDAMPHEEGEHLEG